MFEQMVANVTSKEQAHVIRDAQRFGPVSDAVRLARRRPIRGVAQRLAGRVTNRRAVPVRRRQGGVTPLATEGASASGTPATPH